jgi:hypothetical protein
VHFQLNEITWLTKDVSPLALLAKATIIVLFGLAFGVFYPGLAAYYSGFFLTTDAEERVKATASLQPQATALRAFESQQGQIEKAINELDKSLIQSSIGNINAPEVHAALELRQFLLNKKISDQSTVRVNGFYFGSTMFLWPAFYIFFGWLIFIFPPRSKLGGNFFPTFRRVFWLIIVIEIFYRWPTWARNTHFGQSGRVFFGNGNIDVDPLGFLVQETLALAVSTLLAILWIQWSSYYIERREYLKEEVDSAYYILNSNITEQVAFNFIHWQIASILICAAFFWYSLYFWQTVFVGGDIRFLIPAIITHGIWIITWIFISLPVLITWSHWQMARTMALSALARGEIRRTVEYEHDAQREYIFKAIQELQPVGHWNLTVSAVISIGSLLAPILNGLLRFLVVLR